MELRLTESTAACAPKMLAHMISKLSPQHLCFFATEREPSAKPAAAKVLRRQARLHRPRQCQLPRQPRVQRFDLAAIERPRRPRRCPYPRPDAALTATYAAAVMRIAKPSSSALHWCRSLAASAGDRSRWLWPPASCSSKATTAAEHTLCSALRAPGSAGCAVVFSCHVDVDVVLFSLRFPYDSAAALVRSLFEFTLHYG